MFELLLRGVHRSFHHNARAPWPSRYRWAAPGTAATTRIRCQHHGFGRSPRCPQERGGARTAAAARTARRTPIHRSGSGHLPGCSRRRDPAYGQVRFARAASPPDESVRSRTEPHGQPFRTELVRREMRYRRYLRCTGTSTGARRRLPPVACAASSAQRRRPRARRPRAAPGITRAAPDLPASFHRAAGGAGRGPDAAGCAGGRVVRSANRCLENHPTAATSRPAMTTGTDQTQLQGQSGYYSACANGSWR